MGAGIESRSIPAINRMDIFDLSSVSARGYGGGAVAAASE